MKVLVLILFKLIIIHVFDFFLSDLKTVKSLISHFKALKHTDLILPHLIFKWDNKVVINPGYRYGCEAHSIFDSCWTFCQSTNKYVKGSQLYAPRHTTYLRSDLFQWQSFLFLVYTVDGGRVF